MDTLVIKTKLMRTIVSKLVSRMAYQKLGYKVDIQINDIVANINNGEANIHIDADATMSINEFKKFTKNIGIED